MGYLSQKKHRERENIFFAVASFVMVSISILLLINREFTFLWFNLFHFYCLGGILFVTAVIARKVVPILCLGSALVVIYVLLAISGNIFFSDKISGDYEIEIESKGNLDIAGTLSKGTLIAGNKIVASYAIVNEEAPLMVIMVDFRGIAKNNYKSMFKSLHKFVIKQDLEIVLVGNFGIPAWSKYFRRFIEASGMTVKNRFVFDNIIAPPQFYVLGYKGVGISDITQKNGNRVVKVSYKL